MKTLYIQDLQSGMMVEGETFAVKAATAATDKNGKPYYDLALADKTGEIRGKVWSDNISHIDKQALKVGRVVAVHARVEEFRKSPQLNVSELRGVDESALEEYLETSEFDPDQMWGELQQIVEDISDPHIKKLLQDILSDETISRKYKYWPAAVTVHHSFRSGLLQHVLELATLAKGMERFYPQLNMDLLHAGIILHDIGKLEELDANGIVTQFTKEGGFIGHVILSVEIIDRFVSKDFPKDLLLHLKHIVLAHNGLQALGAPVTPATLEAVMLSKIDDASAKARTVLDSLKAANETEGFTRRNPWLETRLWVGDPDE